MPVKGNAALRYILISSWAKEHKRAMEVARKTTRIHYMELCPLWLSYPSIENFLDGFKREIAFSSRTRPRRGRSYSNFLVAESLSRGSPPFEVGKSHRLIKVK